MSDSQWSVFEPTIYETSKFLGEDDINSIIENMKECGLEEAEVELSFKSDHALKKFMQLYEQQISEELTNYYDDDQEKQVNKFKRVSGLNSSEQEVRQLIFPSYQFLDIFMKFYQTRLRQIETEYHYKLQTWKRFMRIYSPKNEKISSFFKNQIFEMKTKLHLYYCNVPDIIKKVQYSAHFSKLMQTFKIAAVYRINRQGISAAIFYSNVHGRKEIISIVHKHLSEHTTLINLYDKHMTKEVNRNIFKLIASFLSETIKRIEKEQEIVVETNVEKCVVLVHDRHECHTDAKNEILEEIEQMMFFRIEGKDMRSIFNKVIKNHKVYPFLRVKYSRRALFCVFSHPIFHSNHKHITSFCELFKQFFQTLNHENKLTYYLKNLKYPKFIEKVMELTENSNVTVNNFDILMMDERVEFSRVVLGVKALVGMASVVETRKFFYEIFLKIMLRFDFVQNIVKNMKITPDSFSNILGLSKPSTILPQDNYSVISEEEFKREFQALTSPEINEEQKDQSMVQKEISEENSGDQDGGRKKGSYEKREKKLKHIELIYPFKQPQYYSEIAKFWELATRDSKLQKALIKAYPDPFSTIKFKAYILALKEKMKIPPIEQFEDGKIYISTTIEKDSKLSYHLIDLNELKKREKQSRTKLVFIMYKVKEEEIYVPSYVIEFIS